MADVIVAIAMTVGGMTGVMRGFGRLRSLHRPRSYARRNCHRQHRQHHQQT